MSEEFQYQLSVSLPPSEQFAKGDMINIRARTALEFTQNLQQFDQHMAEVAADVVANIRAKWTIIRDAGGKVIEQAQNPHNAPVSAPQAPGGGYSQQAPPQAYDAPPPPPDPQQYGQPYQQAPQQNYQAPAPAQNDGIPTSPPPHVGPAPSCSHGQKGFLAKPYKGGKPGYWMAWSCPARQGDPSQHPLDFIGK